MSQLEAAAGCDPILWYRGSNGKDILIFFSHVHLKTFHSDNYIHRLEINTGWCLLMQKPKNWTRWSLVWRTEKKVPANIKRADMFCTEIYNIAQIADPVDWLCRPHFSFVRVLKEIMKPCNFGKLLPSLHFHFKLPQQPDGGPGIVWVSAV